MAGCGLAGKSRGPALRTDIQLRADAAFEAGAKLPRQSRDADGGAAVTLEITPEAAF